MDTTKSDSALKEVILTSNLLAFVENSEEFHAKVNEATSKINLYEKTLQETCFVEGDIYVDRHQIKIEYKQISRGKNGKFRLMIDDGTLCRPIVESKARIKLICVDYLDELLEQIKTNMMI